MTEILTIIFSFIIFMMILRRGFLASLRPASLVILIIVSLVVGAVLANLVVAVFDIAWKVLVVVGIIGLVGFFILKK